jgi:glycosyltransferase involved in cell wall biosynthesis
MPTVLIVQEHMPGFRVPFYERLREILDQQEVRLRLVYAPNQRNTFLKGQLEWAEAVPIRWMGPLGWQPVLGKCRDCDLVVIQQETKYLLNPVLQMWRKLGGPKVAYWGHGRNFQAADVESREERLKAWLARHVDWWFAYNDLSAQAVEATGFPSVNITSVGNAVDTAGMKKRLRELDPGEVQQLRASCGIRSDNVAVYTGGLYTSKRISFLMEAAHKVRARVPDFELLVIGDGPERGKIAEASRTHDWIHEVGPKNDHDKVPYWAMSKLLLMPGLVGLVVVDSFALGVPLVTTDYPFHSPEIDYLEDGVNGRVVRCGEDSSLYAEAISELMLDPEQLRLLRQGAIRSSELHTIENMATNFAEGVMRCFGSAVGTR